MNIVRLITFSCQCPLYTLQCAINSGDETKKVSQESVLFLVILLPFVRLYRLQPKQGDAVSAL